MRSPSTCRTRRPSAWRPRCTSTSTCPTTATSAPSSTRRAASVRLEGAARHRADRRRAARARHRLRDRRSRRWSRGSGRWRRRTRPRSGRSGDALDVDPAADVDGWPRTGEVPASRLRARLDLPRSGSAGPVRSGTRGVELQDCFVDRKAPVSPASTGSCARCSRRPATPSLLEADDAREAVLTAAEARRGLAIREARDASAAIDPMARGTRGVPRGAARGDLREQRAATAGRT